MLALIKSFLSENLLEDKVSPELLNLVVSPLSLSLMFGVIALVNSLEEEKESRLIEVLFSSVSVRQLLIGKLLALGLAGLLILSISLGLYFAIKIFRVYMLMHGKRPGLKTIMKHIKSA